MIDNLLKNWKTSLTGVLLLALCVQAFLGHISTDQLVSYFAGIAGLNGVGLLVSKDSNK